MRNKKKKINFDDFEILKEGQRIVLGGNTAASLDPGTPATRPTIPPKELPSACDNAS